VAFDTTPEFQGSVRPGGDGGEVPLEAVDEGEGAGKAVGANLLDPLRESVALELSEHLPESADVPGERIQFGADGEDGFELQVLAGTRGKATSVRP
jgi:hypothetical protein